MFNSLIFNVMMTMVANSTVIVMNNDTRYIKTGVGKITYTRILNEEFIILETTNSVYTIKLIS